MLFEGWGTRFPKVSWLCVEGWIQLDVGIVSLGEILCFPCIPNTWLHNQNVSGVYKWEFKYHVGILSNRHMIWYGIYHMFVSDWFCKPILCFVLVYGIRVAPKSSVDSIPFPKRCFHTSIWTPILLDNRDCHVNPFSTVMFLFKWIQSFQHPQDQVSVLLKGVCFIRLQVAFVFPAPHPFFFKDSDFLIKYSFYWWEASPFISVNVLTRCFSWRF